MTAFAKTFGGTSGIIFGIVISVMVIGFCCCCSCGILVEFGNGTELEPPKIFQEGVK